MILFITNKEDVTVDIIVNKLNERSIPYYRFNTEELVGEIEVTFDFEHDAVYLYEKRKELKIDLNDIDSVYFRRAKLPELHSLSDVSEAEKNYLKKESFYLLQGIYDFLSVKYWLNDYWAIRKAENKIFQLQLARKIGFKVPDSLITNCIDSAEKFIKEKECIIKPIKTGAIDGSSKNIFTSILSPRAELDRIQFFPSFFQQHIKKKADIRVTIVGDQFFSAQINSQDREDTEVDWRAGNSMRLEYNHIELPGNIINKCKEFMQCLGLNYGALDFILEPSGSFTFLEINPNGQWGWIENRLNLQISDAIIDLLLTHEKIS
ncbi:hypothetical protein GMJAKD_01535 [Candidatus Electrothrix aarhusensis]